MNAKHLVLLLALPALCGFAHRQPVLQPSASPIPIVSPSPDPTPVSLPSGVSSPVPAPERISVGKISGASPAEIQMIRSGVKLANAMLDKPCFKQWVSAARYSENNGLTSPQIYDRISTVPSSVDIEMYYQNNGVVGFEYDPFDGVVHMNRKFVNNPDMVADNLEHEDRGHSLGFHHYGKFSTSVPYGMNYAYEGCSQQQMLSKSARRHFRPKGLRIEIRKRHHRSVKKRKH